MLREYIRDVQDFPKAGINFKDITTLLQEPRAFTAAISEMKRRMPAGVGAIVGIESRGFIFGAALAYGCGLGFIPARKPGKLPAKTESVEYALEYGTDRLEIHADALHPGQRVLIVDDLLATGGTAAAAADLVQKIGGEVAGFSFLIELCFLKGREKIAAFEVESLIQYE